MPIATAGWAVLALLANAVGRVGAAALAEPAGYWRTVGVVSAAAVAVAAPVAFLFGPG